MESDSARDSALRRRATWSRAARAVLRSQEEEERTHEIQARFDAAAPSIDDISGWAPAAPAPDPSTLVLAAFEAKRIADEGNRRADEACRKAREAVAAKFLEADMYGVTLSQFERQFLDREFAVASMQEERDPEDEEVLAIVDADNREEEARFRLQDQEELFDFYLDRGSAAAPPTPRLAFDDFLLSSEDEDEDDSDSEGDMDEEEAYEALDELLRRRRQER